tara:strand:- start:83 stop:493 length:411 start_codon:yes stop_codon:yes gene_type:complete
MKVLTLIILISSPLLLFGRAPAVNPMFSTTDINGGDQKNFVYIKGEPIELGKISFNAQGDTTKSVTPILVPKKINLAPTFLMIFALSIPLFAFIFMRDEENESSLSEDENINSPMGDVVEVDFKKDKKQENIKKAS